MKKGIIGLALLLSFSSLHALGGDKTYTCFVYFKGTHNTKKVFVSASSPILAEWKLKAHYKNVKSVKKVECLK